MTNWALGVVYGGARDAVEGEGTSMAAIVSPRGSPGPRGGLAAGANISRSAHKDASAEALSVRRSKSSHRLFPIWPVTNVISTDV